jgi:hypothetical protein
VFIYLCGDSKALRIMLKAVHHALHLKAYHLQAVQRDADRGKDGRLTQDH